MDGQRQYPADPEPWFTDNPDGDDIGHVPGQRAGERYPAPPDERYADEAGRVYGGHDRPAYDDPEPPDFGTSDPARRRRPGRPVRVGRRSGLELPEPPSTAEYESPDDAPHYRAERIDRQALRRDGQTYQSQGPAGPPGFESQRADPAGYDGSRIDQPRYDQPGFDQPGFDQPGAGQPGFDQPSFDQSGFDQSSFDQSSFDQPGPDRAPAGRGGDRPDRPHIERPGGMGERADAYPTVPAVYPPGRPVSASLAAPTQAIPASSAPTAVYLARRPGVAVLLGVAAIVVELLLVRVLLGGEFAHQVNAGGVLGGLFAMTGVPMVGVGLYGLACGAATANGTAVGRTWLRPPLAYLPIGLILLVAAGLAA